MGAKTSASRRWKNQWRRQRKRLAVMTLLVLFGGILVVGLMPVPHTSVLEESIQDVGHFAVFGFLSLVVALTIGTIRPTWRGQRWKQYLIGFLSGTLGGVALEVVQGFVPYRETSLSDLLSDTLGALAGISLVVLADRAPAHDRVSRWVAKLALPLFLVTLLLGVWPVISCLRDYAARNDAFPIVMAPGESWTKRFRVQDESVTATVTKPPSDWPAPRPRRVVRVTMRPGEQFPGIGMRDVTPNWSDYELLSFSVYGLESQPVDIVLRIHDFQHDLVTADDRYSRRLTVFPGYQEFTISLHEVRMAPRTRSLELTSIQGVKLYAIAPQRTIHFLVGKWQLKKRR